MFNYTIDEDTELKLLEERDGERLFFLIDSSRDTLCDWLPWIEYTKSVDDTRAFIKGTLQQFDNNDGFQAGIWHRGELAGVVGLHKVNWSNKSTSIGHWLGKGFQGKGLMTNACKAIVNYCFEELRLKRIEIRVATQNYKSLAIPARLGFRKEGHLEKAELLHGRFVDHYIFSLINYTGENQC